MNTKSKRIKDLEEENKNLKTQINNLYFEKTLLNMRYQMEINHLLHKWLNEKNNPTITLPSGKIIFYKELDEEQLDYLENLSNKKSI